MTTATLWLTHDGCRSPLRCNEDSYPQTTGQSDEDKAWVLIYVHSKESLRLVCGA